MTLSDRRTAKSGQNLGNLYRRDIDGLRAVAVLGVLAYHYNLGGVTGGYGGVDVFFVISGFLIAGIIKSELETGTFSLAQFYVRRIRRILPALAVCVLVTTIGATFVLFPYDFRTFGRSIMAVATATSNIFFARKSGDYFGNAAAESPLLHTWSLSIEEQFYAVFPLFVMLLFRYARGFVLPSMAIAAALSLAYSVRAVEHWPVVAFFATKGRVWELLAGTILAFGSVPQFRNRLSRELATLIGAALIVGSYFGYTAATPFPGFAAVPLCLGAALIIHSGMVEEGQHLPTTAVARFLSFAPTVAIGKISYSVYLWHWPLLVLIRYRFPHLLGDENTTQVANGLALAIISIVLGSLSWRFIEQPFRKMRAFEPFWRTYAGALLTLTTAILGSQFIIHNFHWMQGWGPQITALSSQEHAVQPVSNFGSPERREDGWPLGTRHIGQGIADTVLWGDSHALAILPGLTAYVEKTGKAIVAAPHPGCPPLINATFEGSPSQNMCKRLNDLTLAATVNGGIKHVILVALWGPYSNQMYFNPEGTAILRKGEIVTASSEAFSASLEATIDALVQHGIDIVIIGPIPEQKFNVTRYSARHFAWGDPMPEEQTVTHFRDREKRVLPLLASLAQRPNIRVVYPHLTFCDDVSCRYSKNGRPLYSDSNHLNAAGAAELGNMYADLFASPMPIRPQ